MKGHIKQKLYSLASGELVALAVFWLNFFLFKKRLTTPQALISIAYPLLLVSLILLQGSLYWWILIKRLRKPNFAIKQTGRIYGLLRQVDLILLVLGMPIILIEFSSWPVSLIAVAIWLFALIEWVNYFHWQLSYSLNPLVLLSKVAKRKLRKSKIAKEIDKSK
ncbi:hypothetical protein [Abiotrophia sp. HMSC24B09]|uniref:hypothetical protein n=1 Tax=Abiotrophia sp. HMSC24B09 TaxID=1581061 RepID=UPI0008A61E5B|nr:hypothetical protein [Abiotrophia sp. HMSC24B09]OFS29100.1 hypothetical protein HMPREF3093_05510 [Abiotrophia sp. HMSC24B09]